MLEEAQTVREFMTEVMRDAEPCIAEGSKSALITITSATVTEHITLDVNFQSQ